VAFLLLIGCGSSQSPVVSKEADEPAKQPAACQGTPTEACVKEAAASLKTSPSESSQVLSAACDANIASGCAELGMALREGGALPTDAVKGDELLAKACKLDAGYCD
jgi:TPR repeat protein